MSPLVTFAVLSYRQEQFIAAAIRGALSQTYTPLEVLISDDASPDRTFEIIQELTAKYDGPHRIVLNRNEQNLGMGKHIAKVFAMAKGEIIITAAGDDVSLPERVDVTAQAFIDNPEVWGAATRYSKMDEFGTPLQVDEATFDPDPATDRVTRLRQLASQVGGTLPGCSAAYRTSLMADFGPLLPESRYEDYSLSFRALLRGEVKILLPRTVRYREHAGAVTNYGTARTSFREREARAQRHRTALAAASRDNLRALRLAGPSAKLPEPLYRELERTMENALEEQSYYIGLHHAPALTRLRHLVTDLLSREHRPRARWHLRCLLARA